ncbi:biorientation of chromosomes in cell division protein 1-like 1 [Silurus meridionalis]|uniref:biorientation of chromosomes in cell division protein 1-like 1 n=1 Tax=Silurus meridionalis TaxID=175797 RepID=UPI001EEA52F9|nr:biorientation of chromosomes in cell division protein 1-like 1 [Silurus meridionalis]
MAGLPPGDPQLVAMIVNHLKTQGLFDQFRRDCLADVDTKPAYLHLRQRVDNFVSNHLSNHTWSPQLNKNQLRNSIRQLVLQSGLLEQGVDRIVAQVVDPKVQHTFRPQVERVVRQFLSPGNHVEEEEPTHALTQILENQEAYLSSPVIPSAPVFDAAPSQSQDPSVIMAQDEGEEDMCLVEDETEPERTKEVEEQDEKLEGNKEETTSKELEEDEERPKEATEVGQQMEVPVEVKKEEQEEEKGEEKEKKGEEDKEKGEDTKDKKGSGKNKEESSADKLHILQKARERLKEEYSLEDSDLEGLSDITVSSVHTSDLSSLKTTARTRSLLPIPPRKERSPQKMKRFRRKEQQTIRTKTRRKNPGVPAKATFTSLSFTRVTTATLTTRLPWSSDVVPLRKTKRKDC